METIVYGGGGILGEFVGWPKRKLVR